MLGPYGLVMSVDVLAILCRSRFIASSAAMLDLERPHELLVILLNCSDGFRLHELALQLAHALLVFPGLVFFLGQRLKFGVCLDQCLVDAIFNFLFLPTEFFTSAVPVVARWRRFSFGWRQFSFLGKGRAGGGQYDGDYPAVRFHR